MATRKLADTIRQSSAMGPTVKNLLHQYRIDPNSITSTGPHRTILKSDVLNYIDQNKLKPNSSGTSNLGLTQKSTSSATNYGSISHGKISKETVFHINDTSVIMSKYRRKYPSQLEIDVINNGGRLE